MPGVLKATPNQPIFLFSSHHLKRPIRENTKSRLRSSHTLKLAKRERLIRNKEKLEKRLLAVKTWARASVLKFHQTSPLTVSQNPGDKAPDLTEEQIEALVQLVVIGEKGNHSRQAATALEYGNADQIDILSKKLLSSPPENPKALELELARLKEKEDHEITEDELAQTIASFKGGRQAKGISADPFDLLRKKSISTITLLHFANELLANRPVPHFTRTVDLPFFKAGGFPSNMTANTVNNLMERILKEASL